MAAGARIILPRAGGRSVPIVSHAGRERRLRPLNTPVFNFLDFGFTLARFMPRRALPRCGPPSPCAMHGYSGPRPWASFTTREAWLLLSLAPSPAQATL